MPFFQDAPQLGNQFDDDAMLGEWVRARVPGSLRGALEGELRELGGLSGGAWFRAQAEDRGSEPSLTQWDAWGRRVDRIEVTPVWKVGQRVSAERGSVAIPYERKEGAWSRTRQFLVNYVVHPSFDIYACPLAMTDGAARTLLDTKNQALIDRAVPRLTSRDPASMWTSGQWMTERGGGSDVGTGTETIARRDGERWTLHGVKWFTSAATSEMALTLARPEGGPAGSKGLALFYLETRRDDGTLNGIALHRLKDKLGTRKLPTAELTLDGAVAVPVAGLDGGVRNIASMLNITRSWNSLCAVAGMRRGVALAKDYARRRKAFGAPIAAQPLHADTLAWMEAELDGAFALTMKLAELLGAREGGELDPAGEALLRAITPVAKLTTGKQAVAVASETLECFGGAGYVEDTGLPTLLRDAQVLPIWEGTTNVLSLDLLRAASRDGGPPVLIGAIDAAIAKATSAELAAPVRVVRQAVEHIGAWLGGKMQDPKGIEAGARRLALTLGRTLELALLCEHAQASLDANLGPRAAAAARRLAMNGVDLLVAADLERREDLDLLA